MASLTIRMIRWTQIALFEMSSSPFNVVKLSGSNLAASHQGQTLLLPNMPFQKDSRQNEVNIKDWISELRRLWIKY